jgi:hypothetical protein
MPAKAEADDSASFLKALKKGVKDVLSNKDSQPSERVAAITAGAKLLMIQHKINGNDEKGFFE